MKRVVVTGMGIIGPVGHTVEEFWSNIKAGCSGIDRVEDPEIVAFANPVAGEVKNFDPKAIFGAREARRMDRVQQFAVVASQQAVDDSGLEITEDLGDEVGTLIGTGIGGIATLAESINAFAEKGHRGISPVAVPQMLNDGISAKVSMVLGLRGANYDITSACATGNNTIGDAYDMIRLGRAKAMVAGGSEAAVTPVVVASFHNMKALSAYEGDPTKASRPFSGDRTGFVIAEGAAVLLLEELEHALARNAKIYGEMVGYGHTSDAYHVTAPLESGREAARSMKLALREAELQPEDIHYINAHGTGTPLNDKSETAAIKLGFGEAAYDIPVSSTKSMTGHMLGAAGATEAIISLLAMRDGFVPPTINLDVPDPECDLDNVPHEGRDVEIGNVMSYSAGFGGHNTAVIFSKFEA
ncbi:MAG: beta-ketoacyl-ACP synthase II [Chloroflexota bacterium]